MSDEPEPTRASDTPEPAPASDELAPASDGAIDRAAIRRPAWEDELGPELPSPDEADAAATKPGSASEPDASTSDAIDSGASKTAASTSAASTSAASTSAASKPAGSDRLGELLADPPHVPTQGALTGYREGARLRRRIGFALAVGIVAAIAIGRWYVNRLEEQSKRPPTPAYQLAPGTEGESRPDALVWTDGSARLGLSSQDPGVKAIILPDRVLTLAPGHDHAQVKVTVQNGKTVQLKVLVGEIQETSLQGDAP